MPTKTPWWRQILNAITNAPTKTTPKTPAPKASQTEPYVYVTIHGKKFHYDPCCPAILEAFNRGDTIKMDLSKARASGRSACGKCCYDYLHE